MSTLRIIAIVLIVAGIAGIAYGGFTYTKETHEVDLGPVNFSVQERERVNIPLWAGIGTIVVGAGLLLVPKRG